MFRFLVYVSFGLVFAVVFGDMPALRVSDAMFWAWVLAWPFLIGFMALKWLLIVTVSIMAVVLAFIVLVSWYEPRRR